MICDVRQVSKVAGDCELDVSVDLFTKSGFQHHRGTRTNQCWGYRHARMHYGELRCCLGRRLMFSASPLARESNHFRQFSHILMNETELTNQVSNRASLREMVTNSIRYWEPRRLIYNAVLALIVIGYFFASWPASRSTFTFNGILFLFVLTVLANICYCAAHVADIFAQFSGFRERWLRLRWMLLVLGIVFAGIITRFFALGFFTSYQGD